jgi:catechol 2,3-dioxygenase-like lactoylglutathione lyase family enzyme
LSKNELLGFDHVQLAMPKGREEQARQFYVDVLGFDEVPKPDALAARGGCWFESGDVRLHLGVELDFQPAKKAHPALLVSDLRALAATLEASGCAVREDEPLPGYDRLFTDDPFGNRIELMQRL